MMRIAGASLNQTPLDWEQNTFHIKQAISEAKEESIDLLCLPELCITGYGCEDWFLSDWVYEKAFDTLLQLVEFTEGITTTLGLPIRFNNERYNCTCLVRDKQILGFHAKQFLANDGIHYEPRWFSAWPKRTKKLLRYKEQVYPIGEIIFKIDDLQLGIEICEDAWNKDRPACRYEEKNIDIILNPSASHFAFGKTQTRMQLVQESSKDFNCTYVYANLNGNEAGRAIYDGEILIASRGQIIARNHLLQFRDVQVLKSDDTEIAPILSKEEEFEAAVSLGLFDYLRKSKTKGYVISLSGGADSATCAVLVHCMLKKAIASFGLTGLNTILGTTFKNENEAFESLITTAYQGTINSSEDTLKAAESLANEIGGTFYKWSIDDEVNGAITKVETSINKKLTWEADDIALQNIQARARSPFIWLLTNFKNGLLITTSNRSEGDVGYTTMDGDTSGSIAPIAGVDKHFVRNWLKWVENSCKLRSLSLVNNLAPSAELRPQDQNQSDEDDLMPYDLLRDIERLAIFEKKKPLSIYLELKDQSPYDKSSLKTFITRFFKLWSRNQWKRERIAPSFHLDDFNVDPKTWCRFPILNSNFKDELEELHSFEV